MDLFQYENVENALLEYKKLKTRMEAIITVLESCEKKLNENIYWEGAGASYVKQRYSSLLKNIPDLQTAMTELCSYVAGVIDNHNAAEKRMASLFGGGLHG